MKNSDPLIVIIVISCVYNILLRRKTSRAISRHPVEKRTENKTIKSDHDHSLPDNYKTIVLGYDFEGNLFPLPSLSHTSLSSRGRGGRAARSILQLIYVPIVSVHWVTKYPGTGPRTLTAVVTGCNDRRYQQFHRIRPRVVCVCMGA